uniref:Uncharacterized protein n=1 Tax=Anopheles funestus TaxID=62324 RepID=A0A182S0J7_ANOFN
MLPSMSTFAALSQLIEDQFCCLISLLLHLARESVQKHCQLTLSHLRLILLN